MRALEEEKNRCSTALVDIWCVIDFMEKAGSCGLCTGATLSTEPPTMFSTFLHATYFGFRRKCVARRSTSV